MIEWKPYTGNKGSEPELFVDGERKGWIAADGRFFTIVYIRDYYKNFDILAKITGYSTLEAAQHDFEKVYA